MTVRSLKTWSVVTSTHWPFWRVRKVTLGMRLPSELGSCMGLSLVVVAIGIGNNIRGGDWKGQLIVVILLIGSTNDRPPPDGKDMTLTELKYVVALAQERHF